MQCAQKGLTSQIDSLSLSPHQRMTIDWFSQALHLVSWARSRQKTWDTDLPWIECLDGRNSRCCYTRRRCPFDSRCYCHDYCFGRCRRRLRLSMTTSQCRNGEKRSHCCGHRWSFGGPRGGDVGRRARSGRTPDTPWWCTQLQTFWIKDKFKQIS